MTTCALIARPARRRSAFVKGVFGAALAAAVLTGTDLQPRAFAQSVPSGGALAVQTDIFNKVYEGGVARLARGDYASAARTFNILAKIAPEMHEMQYSLAVATTLADFERREWSLPLIQSALAAEPNNALYQFVRVISDPSLSGLRGDALYFSRGGAEMISRITPRLAENGASRNSRFLAPVLATTVKNDDQQWPARLPGFKALVTPGGSVKMPQWTDSVSLGQLLALSIPPERFAPFEHRIIAQLEAGLASLNPGSVDGQKTRGTPTR